MGAENTDGIKDIGETKKNLEFGAWKKCYSSSKDRTK
jgi:hypothetical protein